MSTQEDFWNSVGLGNQGGGSDDPLPPVLKFLKMNEPIQGFVVDTYQTTEKGFNGAPDPTDRNGNPRPQLVLTLKLRDGTLGRVFLKTDLLWKTRDAMAAHGMSSLGNGTFWQGAWTDQEQLERGTAKRHKVQVTPPSEG